MNASDIPSATCPPDIVQKGVTGTWRHLFVIAAVTLFVCWPVLVHGLPDLGNDSIVHALMDRCFDIQFWNGDLYPRWLADMNAGLGSPNFFFQPPVPAYAAALFWPLVAHYDPYGFHAIGLACVLAVLLSGVAVYFWGRSFASPPASLFAAVIYIILPYHLAVDMYTRGAASELWANVWVPLILLAVNRMVQGSKWALPGLIASYGLLVLTHLPTVLCFSLVPLGAAFWLAEDGKRIRTTLKTAIGLAIGAGIGAAYLVPGMLDKKNATDLGQMNSGWFDYRHWWLLGIHPLLDARTRLMILTLLTFAFAAVLGWIFWKSRFEANVRRQAIFQCAIGAIALLMTTQISAPVWSVIPSLHMLQFPTRFLQVFIVMVAGISALAFPYVFERRWRIAGSLAALLVCTWMVANVWAASMSFSVWRSIPDELATLYSKWRTFRHEDYSLWPRWTPALQINRFPAFDNYVAEHPPRASKLIDAATGSAIGQSTVESWQPRHVRLQISAPEPARFIVNHLYYPGWTGHVEGSNTLIPAVPSKTDGFIQLDVPKGNYYLILELRKEFAERMGDDVSMACIALLAAIAFWNVFQTRKQYAH